MKNQIPKRLALCAILLTLASECFATELATLSETNWDKFAMEGKEVDRIYGDLVLRNDKITAVLAKDVPTRNANLTVRQVGGCLIDLALRNNPNDQLSAFYPVSGQALRRKTIRIDNKNVSPDKIQEGVLTGKTIEILYETIPNKDENGPDGLEKKQPRATVIYRLADGDEALEVETNYENPTDDAIPFRLRDPIRLDGEFVNGVEAAPSMFWAYDRFWRQAYGVFPKAKPDLRIVFREQRRRDRLNYSDASHANTLAPGETYTFTRTIAPALDPVALKAIAARAAKKPLDRVELSVTDADGPVGFTDIEIQSGESTYGLARTDDQGMLTLELPPGDYRLVAKQDARGKVALDFQSDQKKLQAKMNQAGYLVGKITSSDEDPIACKVDIEGMGRTQSPNFGPDSAIYAVRNLVYTPDGRFRVAVKTGKYQVLVSHGPEYDAVTKDIVVSPGKETTIETKLVRSVDTTGWISAEFHSHSSPSGDNTSSQRGRVLNLLAEHLEFAPCTEHNRISTYSPHLEFFNATKRMATCSGMELTGRPLPLNHQNAFPLVMRPRTQDGGGPTTDFDPVVQIERLAMWDDGGEKLVQSNHPNISQMFGDRDQDGNADGGFRKMFQWMNVIEVHPPGRIFEKPESLPGPRSGRGNAMFHWLQLYNLGYRIPGVVNTDAHWNFHGSGFLRNYIRSDEDDPANLDPMVMVRNSKAGRMSMTNGPFLEVQAESKSNDERNGEKDKEKNVAELGDELLAKEGKVTLSVRVQCPNWHSVNRVQVFVNGHPLEKANFTRHQNPDMFRDGTVKFNSKIPLELSSDASIVVATSGEGLTLGRVVGPEQSKTMPVAVSNPIFIDVDGGGFKPNGDMLGLPLPGKEHAHGH